MTTNAYTDLLLRIEDDTIILANPHRYPGFDPRSVQADLDEALDERDLISSVRF